MKRIFACLFLCLPILSGQLTYASTVDEYQFSRVHKTEGLVFKVEVFPAPTAKPNEGDGSVEGTVRWAIDQFPIGKGGEVVLMGGDNYKFSTALTIVRDGVNIRCKMGRKSGSLIQPSGNLTWLWVIGTTTTKMGNIVEGCHFNGLGSSSNTSGGIQFKNQTESVFKRNQVADFKGVSLEINSTISGTNVNRVADNIFTGCGDSCIKTTGTAGNFDHWITNNIAGGGTPVAPTTNPVVDLTVSAGGYKIMGNHWVGRNNDGCVKISSGNSLTISDEFWDTCGDDAALDATVNNSNISGRIYQNDNTFTQPGIEIRGNNNNVGPVVVYEPGAINKITDGILIYGDDNNINAINCDGISGDCVAIESGANNNKIGFVQSNNIGGVELVNGGTNDNWIGPKETLCYDVGDEDTTITSGTAKKTIRIPYKFKILDIKASLSVASTTSYLIVDINDFGTSILSTRIAFNDSKRSSHLNSTPAVISDDFFSENAEVTIDIDDAGSGAKGLKVCFIGHQT